MVKILSKNEQITGLQTQPNKLVTKDKHHSLHNLKQKLIKEIVKKALIELVISLAFTAVACLFVATPVGMITLAVAAVAAIALNIIFRSISAFCAYRLAQLKHDNSEKALDKKIKFQIALNFFQFLSPITFSSLVDTNTREVLIHEAGHALAANILIKNPRTQISIDPFKGGQTTYRLGALSKIGEFFGRENSKLLIAAAGPVLALGTATIGFGAALALRKSKPELSRYLKIMSINSVAQHAFYALSALWTSATQKGHDFIQLMAGGLHPIAAVVSIVALPIIVKIGFFIFDKIKERSREKALQKEQLEQQYKIQLPKKNVFNKPFAVQKAHNITLAHA